MARCTVEATKQWDMELNRIYKALRTKLGVAEKQKLLESQRAWIQFRDLEFAFSDTFVKQENGTIAIIDDLGRKMNFVRERVMQLDAYLHLATF